MGTSNFYSKDELFVAELNDEEDYDILTDNICYRLDVLDDKISSKNKRIEFDIYGGDEPTMTHSGASIERNFSSVKCGQVTARSTFMGLELRMDLDILVRNGYYEHTNIDYVWNFSVDGIDFNEEDEGFEVLKYSDMSHYPEGLIEMNRKRLDKRIEDMRAMVREVFLFIGKTYGKEYNVAARFSNGETMYSKAQDDNKDVFELLTYTDKKAEAA